MHAQTLVEKHSLETEVLRQRLHHQGAEQVMSLEERWNEESLSLRCERARVNECACVCMPEECVRA